MADRQSLVQTTEWSRSADPNAPSNPPTHEPLSPHPRPDRVFQGEFGYGPDRSPPGQIRATRNGNRNTAEHQPKTHIRISNLHRQLHATVQVEFARWQK